MEDRYLFKAKHIHVLPNNNHLDGSWAVGFLSGERYIANDSGEYLIDPTTICQCTGSRDKNSKLIYDNDIAKDEKGNLYKAFWQKNYYQYSWICIKSNYLPIGAQWNLWSIKSFEIEVIGNIFDNKELLESEE